MIGKVTLGASFYHCLSYCLEDKRELSEEQKKQLSLQEGLQHKNRAEVIDNNLCFGDKKDLAEQFRDVAKLSKRVEKPVMHLTIRSAPGDKLTMEQWRKVGRSAAHEFGLADHQFVCILHKDTKQPHIHLVANRVGYDGKAASDSNSYARMVTLCRHLEKELNLQQVLSPRRFLSPQQRQLSRHDQRKDQLKTVIQHCLQGTCSYQEFEKKMQDKGYRVDKGRGIAFEDDKKVRTKGSEVGYSWQTIERLLAQNEQHRHKLSSPHPEDKHEQRTVAREAVNRVLRHHPAPIQEKTLGAIITEQMSNGISDLFQELLKPEYSQGGGRNPWADEEEWKRKKKIKGRSYRP